MSASEQWNFMQKFVRVKPRGLVPVPVLVLVRGKAGILTRCWCDFGAGVWNSTRCRCGRGVGATNFFRCRCDLGARFAKNQPAPSPWSNPWLQVESKSSQNPAWNWKPLWKFQIIYGKTLISFNDRKRVGKCWKTKLTTIIFPLVFFLSFCKRITKLQEMKGWDLFSDAIGRKKYQY